MEVLRTVVPNADRIIVQESRSGHLVQAARLPASIRGEMNSSQIHMIIIPVRSKFVHLVGLVSWRSWDNFQTKVTWVMHAFRTLA